MFGDQSKGSGGRVATCESADLASREPKSFSGPGGLEFTVDNGLNALQSIDRALQMSLSCFAAFAVSGLWKGRQKLLAASAKADI